MSAVDRAAEVLRASAYHSSGSQVLTLDPLSAAASLHAAGLFRTEADDANRAIADRVRAVRRVASARRTAFGAVTPVQFARTEVGDIDHVFDLLDYLLNGGESCRC